MMSGAANQTNKPMSMSMLSADKDGKKLVTAITSKRASQGQSMRSTSKGKSGGKEKKNSVITKPFMQTSTA
jgi:hypothetical protein